MSPVLVGIKSFEIAQIFGGFGQISSFIFFCVEMAIFN